MRLPASAPAGVALLVAAGCGSDGEPAATLTAVSPAEAYNDSAVAVSIAGGPFRPAYAIDTVSGEASVDAGAFAAFLSLAGAAGAKPARTPIGSLLWRDENTLAGTVPVGLAAGEYDVVVHDPRGNDALLPMGFTSLGPDTQPPVVSLSQPVADSAIAAGTAIVVALHADDGPGHLKSFTWQVSSASFGTRSGACGFAPGAGQAPCSFTFTAPEIPTLTEPLTVSADAADTAGNATHVEVEVRVALPPKLDTFTPTAGPANGMVQVALTGQNFVRGTQVMIGNVLLLPNGGVLDSVSTMHGSTPVHDPGVFPVVVRTGSATSGGFTYEFVAKPVLRAVSPASGPAAGGNPVIIAGDHFRDGGTTISFGLGAARVSLLSPSFVSANRIEGVVPAGAGTVSIFASDPIGGEVEMADAYTYLAPGAPDAAPGDGGAGDSAADGAAEGGGQ
jgi:hypothetical protein